MKSTNYFNTFITVGEHGSRAVGTVPPVKAPPTVAALQYEMISANPYKFTSDEILFKIHCIRNGEAKLQDFFGKGQACLRVSPLPKSYGWGLHFNEEGKVALYGVETAEYKKFKLDKNLKQKRAYVSKR